MASRFLLALLLLLGGMQTESSAQVVQLPTFTVFSVSTSVMVPDSGRGALGGVHRGRWRQRTSALPGFSRLPLLHRLSRRRASSASASSSAASASATVLDAKAMDAAVLEEAKRRTGEVPLVLSGSDREALSLSRHVARRSEEADTGRSLLELKAAQAERARQRQAVLQGYLKRAQQAEKAKHYGSARIAYRLLYQRASGPLKALAAQKLAALNEPIAVPSD